MSSFSESDEDNVILGKSTKNDPTKSFSNLTDLFDFLNSKSNEENHQTQSKSEPLKPTEVIDKVEDQTENIEENDIKKCEMEEPLMKLSTKTAKTKSDRSKVAKYKKNVCEKDDTIRERKSSKVYHENKINLKRKKESSESDDALVKLCVSKSKKRKVENSNDYRERLTGSSCYLCVECFDLFQTNEKLQSHVQRYHS